MDSNGKIHLKTKILLSATAAELTGKVGAGGLEWRTRWPGRKQTETNPPAQIGSCDKGNAHQNANCGARTIT